MNILFKNIKSLAGIRSADVKLLKGNELNELPSIEDAWLHVQDGKIAAYGGMKGVDFNLFKVEGATDVRSEERRGGEGGGCRGWRYH